MPRICKVCIHEHRDAIDNAIVSQMPIRQIAAVHAVSDGSVRRHAANHLPETLARASAIQAVATADDLLSQAQRLQEEARGVLEFAKADGNPGGVLQAIDRLQKGIVLMASLRERVPEGDGLLPPEVLEHPEHIEGVIEALRESGCLGHEDACQCGLENGRNADGQNEPTVKI